MNAPGKTLLKVVSILYIIFGALFALAALLSLILGSMIGALVSGFIGNYGALVGGAVSIVLFIVFLILAAIDLVAGIVGVKQCGDPSKATFFIVFGFILGGLTLIGFLTNFQLGNLIGLVMPVLFVVGGFLNKNAAKPVA